MELYVKALHLIFVVTWFSGLFYMVRLLVYHAEAHSGPTQRREILLPQFQLMEKRLWYGITWPSAVLVLSSGAWLAVGLWPLGEHPWLVIKLVLVGLLFAYHLSCGYLYHCMGRDVYPLGGYGLRLWNEVATLFLFGIVFLAVCKDGLDMLVGLAGLVVLGGALWWGILLYRMMRHRQPPP